MKIMKAVDKKVGAKTYYEYKIILPKKVVEESKFEVKEFNIKLKNGKIVILKE